MIKADVLSGIEVKQIAPRSMRGFDHLKSFKSPTTGFNFGRSFMPFW